MNFASSESIFAATIDFPIASQIRVPDPDTDAFTDRAERARHLRRILKARSQRSGFFRAGLFGDPAWDMLLELYASKLAQQRISVSGLCCAAGVPATTALRWIDTLVREGLAQRENDRRDRRRVFIEMTDAGEKSMSAYLRSLPPHIVPM